MNKFILMVLFFFTTIFSSVSFAQENNTTTIANVKIGLIKNLQKDGYLSERMAKESVMKYVSEKDKIPLNSIAAVEAKSKATWSDFMSWTNFLKVVGVIFILVAFFGVIKRIILGMWILIVSIPVEAYQTVGLAAFTLGTLNPQLIWEAQHFYVALFSSIANLIILGWILETHPKIKEFIGKLLNLGIPVACIISFYAMLYFGALAIAYDSSIFGFLAAVGLSGMFSFGMYYSPGVLFLDFKENMLGAVVGGHIAVLIAYVALHYYAPALTAQFDIGIQYYCTIALGVGLLVGSSPFYASNSNSVGGYVMLFILAFIGAGFAYFFYDLPVIGSIIFVFFTLFVLEWIGYLGYQTGMIIGSAMLGGSLFGLSMLFEKYGSLIMLTLK